MFRALAVAVSLLCSQAFGRAVFVSFDDRAKLPGPIRARTLEEVLAAAGQDGAEVREISEITRALFSPGMLVPEFDRAPPPGWPEDLRNDWEQGNAGCRQRVSRLPSAMLRASAAVQCQKDLSRALFGRFLDREKPALVLEVTSADAASTRDGSRVALYARVFSPDASAGRRSSREAPRAETARAARELATQLMHGGGDPARVDLPRALPGSLRP